MATPRTAKRSFTTAAGVEVAPYYTSGDVSPGRVQQVPGQEPYTRGIDPEGYRKELWIMGHYAGYASAEETNKRFKYLLAKGQHGFSVALDLPTQIGLDSDHPLSRGEVGKIGVPIDCLDDMLRLMDGVPLANVRQIRTSGNAIGPIWSALCIGAAEAQGLHPNQMKTFIQNDILKEYVARGTHIFPPEPAVEFAVDVIEYASKEAPDWISYNACGYHMREAGADAVQELAFTLANACAYLDSARRRGLEIAHCVPTIYMLMAAQMDMFEEICKFRAARSLWVRLLKERYGVTDPAGLKLKTFGYTAGSTLTYQQPLNNIIRIAYEALMIALGGAQTISLSSYDEARSLPSEVAATIAVRTQQILAYETGITRVVDPLGGSHYVERLTEELETRAWDLIKKIDEMGGAVEAIQSGWMQKEIAAAAYRRQRAVDSGDEIIVGVNKFTEKSDDEGDEDAFAVQVDNLESEQRQIERLQAHRRNRSQSAVAASLRDLQAAVKAKRNTVMPSYDCLKAGATLGEMCDALREIWGEQPREIFS